VHYCTVLNLGPDLEHIIIVMLLCRIIFCNDDRYSVMMMRILESKNREEGKGKPPRLFSLDMIWSWKSSSPVTVSAAGSQTSQSSVMGVIDLLLQLQHNTRRRRMTVYCIIQGGPKKTGPFLNVDNFATVSGRKACDMSKVCKFFSKKSIKLA